MFNKKSLRFKIAICISILFLSVPAHTQKTKYDGLLGEIKSAKSDTSRASLYLFLSKEAYSNSVDTAIYYAQIAASLNKKDMTFQSGVSNWLSECFMQKGNRDKALAIAMQGLKYASSTRDQKDDFRSCLWLAELYSESMQDTSRGLEYATLAIQIAKNSGDLKMLIEAQERMAGVYGGGSNKVLAEKYIRGAYQNALKLGDGDVTIGILSHLAIVCLENGKNNEAIQLYIHGIELCQTAGDKVTFYGNLGNTYYESHQFDSALHYYSIGKRLAEENGLEEFKAIFLSAMANTYSGKGNFENARKIIDTAIMIEQKRGSIQRLSFLYLAKANTADSLCNYKEAYRSYKEFKHLSDSIVNSEKNKAIAALEIQYQTEKKEQEIISLTKDKELQEQQLENQKIIRNASVGGIILLLILIAVIMNRYRLKRSIAMQRMQQRISSDLHDDIGASLTSINILSQLSQQQKIDTATRNEYLHKIIEQTAEVTDALRDIVWSINPKNDKLDIILARMKRYTAELLEPNNIEYNFETNIVSTNETINADIRQNLYLIFKEAINNLAKYSGATKAVIIVNKHAGHLYLEVKDNGLGFDPVHVTKGNGLENMQRRAKAMHTRLNLSSENNIGTTITVNIPL